MHTNFRTKNITQCQSHRPITFHFFSRHRMYSVYQTNTRHPAITEGPREHAVSWNLVKCCTNGQGIASKKPSYRWMTFKVIQLKSLPLVPFDTIDRPYDFLLVFHWKHIPISYRFRYINTFLPKIWDSHVTLITPTSGSVCRMKVSSSHSQPVHKIWWL